MLESLVALPKQATLSEEVRDESERTDLDWPYVMRFAVIWRERLIYLLEASKWRLPFQEII